MLPANQDYVVQVPYFTGLKAHWIITHTSNFSMPAVLSYIKCIKL